MRTGFGKKVLLSELYDKIKPKVSQEPKSLAYLNFKNRTFHLGLVI